MLEQYSLQCFYKMKPYLTLIIFYSNSEEIDL